MLPQQGVEAPQFGLNLRISGEMRQRQGQNVSLEQQQVAGRLLAEEARVADDPPFGDVEDTYCRPVRPASLTQRQMVAAAGSDAHSRGNACLQSPHYLAVFQADSATGLVADDQHLTTNDTSDVEISVLKSVLPQEMAVVQAQAVDGIAVRCREDHLAVAEGRCRRRPRRPAERLGDQVIGVRPDEARWRLQEARRVLQGRPFAVVRVGVPPQHGPALQVNAEDGAGVAGADEDTVAIRKVGGMTAANRIVGCLATERGEAVDGQELAVVGGEGGQAQLAVLLGEDVDLAGQRQRWAQEEGIAQGVGGFGILAAANLPHQLAAFDVVRLQVVVGEDTAPDSTGGRDRLAGPVERRGGHDLKIIDGVDANVVGAEAADHRVLEQRLRTQAFGDVTGEPVGEGTHRAWLLEHAIHAPLRGRLPVAVTGLDEVILSWIDADSARGRAWMPQKSR